MGLPFCLDLIEFPEQAVLGEVAPAALNGLLFMSGPLYWIIVVASIGFMAMYQLTERRHGEIVAELKVRRVRGQNMITDK